MTIQYSELKEVITEAAPLLRGRNLLGFRDGGPDTFLLILEAGEGVYPRLLRLLISVRPGLGRAHLTPRPSPKKNKVPFTRFAATVEEEIKGMTLASIEAPGRDRVVKIDFEARGRPRFSLVAELIGRHANLLFLDEDQVIRDLVRTFEGKTRCLRTGVPYPPLPPPARRDKKKAALRFPIPGDAPWAEAPLNGAADAFFLRMEEEAAVDHLRKRLLKNVARRRKAQGRKRTTIHEQIQGALKADEVKKTGDLLQAHFHLLKRGLSEIEVDDLFDPSSGKVAIPLDPAKDGAANVAEYYRRAKKLKNSMVHLSRRAEEMEGLGKRLEELETEISGAETREVLEGIAGELGVDGLSPAAARKTQARENPADARRFLTSDGLPVLVGKDGSSNDRLTFRMARGNDMWLHCQGAAGSHVVIRAERNKPVPLNSLMDGALLAVHYSKARGRDRAEVIYTARKHVRRARGRPAGTVIVDRFKTLEVRNDPEGLKRVLESARDRDGPSRPGPCA